MISPVELSRRRLHRRVGVGLLVAVMATFVATATTDHGYNWDEWKQIETLRTTVREVEYTKTRHVWNGMAFLPGVAVLVWHAVPRLPAILAEMRRAPDMPFDPNRYPSLREWQTDMYRALGTERFKSEVRTVHVLLTALALLWVFLTVVRVFPHRHLEAAAAAAFVGLSWEVSQRARCTEVDAPMMAFAALLLYLISVALTVKSRERGLLCAMGLGAAAGLVLGCKVSGAYTLLPAIVAVFNIPLWKGARDRFVLLSVFFVAWVAAFATVSPDTYVDPLRAIHNSFYTMRDYASIGPERPNYVEPPFEHLYRVSQWLFLVQPSASVPIAGGLSIFTLVGAVALFGRRRRFAIIAALYPLLLLVTMAPLALLQLRNYLQVVPFLGVAFGAGLVLLLRHPGIRARRLHVGIGAAVALAFAFNAGFLVYADHSVRVTTRDDILEDVREHLESSRSDLYVSDRLHRTLDGFLEERYACERGAPAEGSPPLHDPRAIFYYTDHDPWLWRGYRMGYVERTFAPLDANYDWYVVWKGKLEHHRVVLMDPHDAEGMGVDLGRLWVCRRRAR